MKVRILLAAAALAACSSQKPQATSAVASTDAPAAKSKYECNYDLPRKWESSTDLHDLVTENLEVTPEQSDILGGIQYDQVVAAALHLGFIQEGQTFQDVLDRIDDNRPGIHEACQSRSSRLRRQNQG